MVVLNRAPEPLPQSVLRERARLTPGNAYRLVTKLSTLGLIEKRKEGKENRIKLTDAGQSIAAEIVVEAQRRLIESLRVKLYDLAAAWTEMPVSKGQAEDVETMVTELQGLGTTTDARPVLQISRETQGKKTLDKKSRKQLMTRIDNAIQALRPVATA